MPFVYSELSSPSMIPIEPIGSVSKRYALLIGIDDFEDNKVPNLVGVKEDLKKFEKILQDSSISDFQVTTILNANLVEIRKAILDISKKAQKNDVIFYYFSGHGALIEEPGKKTEFVSVCSDSEFNYLEATCLDSEYVLSQFRKSACNNFIIILDTCHSGAFFNNNRGIPDGLFALTSGGEFDFALEKAEGGVFTNIIIEALTSDYIDANRDGIITFSDLFRYIIDRLKNDSNMSTPKKWEWNVDKDIILLKSPKPVFISYQRQQEELVIKISNYLKNNDIVPFIDQEKIRIGDNWRELLEKTIENSRAFIFILDKQILNSEVANWELKTAHQYGIPIFPIEVEEIELHAMFTDKYGHYNRMIFDDSDFQGSMKKIIDHIKSIRIMKENLSSQEENT